MNPNPAAGGRFRRRRVRAGGTGRRKALVFALFAPLLAACSGGSNSAKEDAGTDPSALTYDPTFTAVYNEILQGSCAVAFCHIGVVTPMALPDQATAYKALVNVPAATANSGGSCQGKGMRVLPGNPDMSLLYEKLVQPVPCGLPMPGSGHAPLEARQIDQIKQWITLGAKND